METEKKRRKYGPRADCLAKSVMEYNAKLESLYALFEELASGFHPDKKVEVKSPSFLEMVVIPLFTKLAEALPGFEVSVPARDAEPDRHGLFPVVVNSHPLAGIGFAGKGNKYVNVYIFAFGKTLGAPLHIRSMKELLALLDMLMTVANLKQPV